MARSGRSASSLERRHRAIALAPGEFYFYLARARILGQRGKIGPARRDIARAIKLSKDAGDRAACQQTLDQIVGSKRQKKKK